MGTEVMRSIVTNLYAWTHSLNAVHRATKAHFVLKIGNDVMVKLIARMVTTKLIAHREPALHKNSVVTMADAYLKSGCGKFFIIPTKNYLSTLVPFSSDEDTDCEDGSDEKNCDIKNCTSKEFQCKSGRCIPLSWVCDGEEDCPNKEDESAQCRSPDGGNTCQPTYFRCASGKCIPGRWECDYEADCNDNSDEHANCVMRNCSSSEFRCHDGHCIPGIQQCDGEYNCNDMSDELPCHEKNCTSDEFKCPNHNVCINKKFICGKYNLFSYSKTNYKT